MSILCITFFARKWYNYAVRRGNRRIVRPQECGVKMLELNETVMYGTTGVCTVEKIEEKKIGKVTKSYYVLKPVANDASTVYVPTDNEKLLAKVRKLISKAEIDEILSAVSKESDIWPENDGERKLKFGEIIASGDRKACLVMLRTLYKRQNMLTKVGKRLHMADERAMKEARRLISDEFSVVLGIGTDDVGAYLRANIK